MVDAATAPGNSQSAWPGNRASSAMARVGGAPARSSSITRMLASAATAVVHQVSLPPVASASPMTLPSVGATTDPHQPASSAASSQNRR